jgi:glutamate/tyrosine decarboxylase-like PLP-dependent enzyme
METMTSPFAKTLESVLRHADSYLSNLDRTAVAATADLATLRTRLRKELTQAGVSPEQVIAELTKDVEGGLLGSAGGRFFAWVIGGSLPSALAADWLTSVWDQNAGIYACSPAAAVVEEVAGEWLKSVLGLPASASFALVTGCQMAHVTCLAAARHALLARRGWNVEEAGLFGAPPIRILSSGMRHGTFERALRLLGLGKSHVVLLPADSEDRVEPNAVENGLQSDPKTPTIVLLQAGDINI